MSRSKAINHQEVDGMDKLRPPRPNIFIRHPTLVLMVPVRVPQLNYVVSKFAYLSVGP